MFSRKLLDEFMNAPWRLFQFSLTRLIVRQDMRNDALPNG